MTKEKNRKETIEDWACLWYQCLSENYDYSKYSDAREANDFATCALYEKQFEKIADIYNDFGKLESLITCQVRPYSWFWNEWFEAKLHLFMPAVEKFLSDRISCADDNLLLSIPLSGKLEDTVSAAAIAIEAAFERSKIANTQQPKYQLKLGSTGKPAMKFEIVKHAVITSISKYSYQPSPENGASINKISLAFIERHHEAMGWPLGQQEKKDLVERDFLSPERQESFKTLINRHRRTFRALSRNTLRASFPDTRPFKSAVWDRFKGAPTYS